MAAVKYLDENGLSTVWSKVKGIVTPKADKVSGATAGHLAGLNSSGNLVDSGVAYDQLGNEEDIDQNEGGKLQFANRVYNAQQPNGMGYKILRKNASFASQVTEANTIYEIRYDFDLDGRTVTLPSGCILQFVGGCLSNGVLVGVNTMVRLQADVFNAVELRGTFSSDKNTVSSSIFKTWSPFDFLNAVLLCNEGGTVTLDKDFTYTSSKRIVISKSITIDGCGKTLTTFNSSNNHTLGLFEISDCESFTVKNITIDGGITVTYDSDGWPVVSNFGPAEDTYFILTKRVRNVVFESCDFQNIYAPNLANYQDPHNYGPGFIMIVDYEQSRLTNCHVFHEKNVFTSEGFQFRPKTGLSLLYSDDVYDEHQAFNAFIYNNYQSYGIDISRSEVVAGINDHPFPNNVIVENCVIDFTNTSSALEIRFGMATIRNNVFGTTTGSVMNAFIYDSEISGNSFDNVHRSGAIDLDEQGFVDYIPTNVRIVNNTFGFSREGFLMFYRGSNITIDGNNVDGCELNTERLDYFDSRWQPYDREMSCALYIMSGDVINITNNVIKGYKQLFSGQYYTYNEPEDELILNVTIANNTLEQLLTSNVVNINLRRSGTQKILNNTVINAGRVYFYRAYWRAFVTTQYLKYYASSDIQIDNNTFLESRNDVDCIGYASLYNFPGDGIISAINIKKFSFCNNTCNKKTYVSIFTQEPDITVVDGSIPRAVVKNNELQGGTVFGVINIDTDEKVPTGGAVYKGNIAADNPYLNQSWNFYSNGFFLKKGDIIRVNTNASLRNSFFEYRSNYTGIGVPAESLSTRNNTISKFVFCRKGENLYFCLVSGKTAATYDGIDYDSDDFIVDGEALVVKVGTQPSNLNLYNGIMTQVDVDGKNVSDYVSLYDDAEYLPADFNFSVIHVYGKITLGSQTITLKNNSILIVHPGANISLGTIVGSNTLLIIAKPISCSLGGTFRNIAYNGLPQTIHSNYAGQQIYDKVNNRLAIWSGTAWVDSQGKTVGEHGGTTSTRTSLSLSASTDIGYTFFDTDLGKMVVWNGSAWVNMDGTAL